VGLAEDEQSNSRIVLVGELKTPWVTAHDILSAANEMDRNENEYGFFGTYEQTIFLRQVVDAHGSWGIEYSPVIHSTIYYQPTEPTDLLMTPSVSVKQCMFHVCRLASVARPTTNNNPEPQWVSRNARLESRIST
jgi:hypothetical protein